MFKTQYQQHVEVAELLQHIITASELHVKKGGRPPRDIISIPNLKRLVSFLPELDLKRYTQVMQMSVFEATLYRYDPYVASLEQAGLLPAGFAADALMRVREMRAKKEKGLGLRYLQSQSLMMTHEASKASLPQATLSAERAGMASAMQKILDGNMHFLQAKGLARSPDSIGQASTKRLKTALEDPEADRLFLVFCLGHFESTMMEYENNVLGLEEMQFLPLGFADMTIERIRALRVKIMEPVPSGS